MIFQSDKNQLWRYASDNLTAAIAVDAMANSPQQPPHRHQHQHRLQCHQQDQQLNLQYQPLCGNYSDLETQNQQQNTPPPPYSSLPYGMDYSDASTITQGEIHCTYRQQQIHYPTTDAETETSISGNDLSDIGIIGYNYENYGDVMHVDDYEQTNCISSKKNNNRHQQELTDIRYQQQHLPISTNYTREYLNQQQRRQKQPPLQRQQQQTTNAQLITGMPIQTPTTNATSTTFAKKTFNMIRNCCRGGGSSSTETTTPATTIAINHNNNIEDSTTSLKKMQMIFNAFNKQLGKTQTATLLKAVESRMNMKNANKNNIAISNTSFTASSSSSSNVSASGSNKINHQTQCILLQRKEICGEEPNVLACRLFFWFDLRNGTELKRLPICSTERDPYYVCCNPVHWYRICETEIAPPPYQNESMERLTTQDPAPGIILHNREHFILSNLDGNEDSNSDCSISNTNKITQTSLRVRIPESLTTDGQDRSASQLIWCQVSYWELSQRVGERFAAHKPAINIFSDISYSSGGSSSAGICEQLCLNKLVATRKKSSPGDVQNTRQKIGLGVVISQEADGVWLYNRSPLPVFLNSPTLSENGQSVFRIESGKCLNAFDTKRIQTLKNFSQCSVSRQQRGPMDLYSMRLSFSKGWGSTYKRQDITCCPCWLEFHFPQQR